MENYSDISGVPVDFQFTMETEELIKLVDGIYKNILDKFNPGARQMINAGKAYLKALHGAAAASRLYVDAISKLARQAQQGTWGGSSDIGSALMRIVEVYKEIQEQQMNILKAFYVDLLVPLETNLEKDTKVVQSEQKKFLQQHKQRSETYSKAAAMMKKQRKKSRGSTKTGIAMDKELKNMQVLEEEKTKLDAFCEQSLKTAMTQERRRYGFVLERQCSLAKHYLSYHSQGVTIYQQNIDEWNEVAKTREFLPEAVENMFTNRLRQVTFWPDEDVYSNPRSPQLDDDRLSITSQLRKTKSMDASCLDIRSIGDAASPMLSLSRAKSEYNLTASTPSLAQDCNSPSRRPKSMALPPMQQQWDFQLARALYAYLSSGENQLSFLEGDMIALMGERTKGWQFGENLRTQCSGWFPLAYTEIIDDPTISPSHRPDMSGSSVGQVVPSTPTASIPMSPRAEGHSNNTAREHVEPPTPRMFGDTLHLHRSSANAKQIRRVTGSNNYVPPPALPAPVPTPQVPFTAKTSITQSQSTNFTTQNYPNLSSFPPSYTQTSGLKTSTSSFNFSTSQTSGYSTHPQGTRPPPMPPLPLHLQSKGGKMGVGVGNVSLHSSNDSGFSNDPPPQPEVDYSDDESPAISKVPIRVSQRKVKNDSNNNPRELRELPPRQSTQGNLVGSQPNLRDDRNDTLRSMQSDEPEKRGLIKRTKSFWKFGRHSDEILEGMSLWKHRDLVDVFEQINVEVKKSPTQNVTKTLERNSYNRTTGSERSNDSDKTLQAKQYPDNDEEIYGTAVETPKRRPSFKGKPKLSLPARENDVRNGTDFEESFEKPKKVIDDQFYDDDGDGLMRTVNRKSILQQYNTDSTDANSDESESDEMTSDDPYDCIVVDDHTTLKRQRKMRNGEREDAERKEKYPNVAEIGKKLEKLSKSSKFGLENKEKRDDNRRDEIRREDIRRDDIRRDDIRRDDIRRDDIRRDDIRRDDIRRDDIRRDEIRRDEYRNSVNNKINKLTAYNNDKNLEMSMKSSESEPQEEEIKVRRYNGTINRNGQPVRSPSPAQRHSFKTFGHPVNDRPEKMERTRHHSESSPTEPEVFVKPRHFEKKYQENDEEKLNENERRDKIAYYQERRDDYEEENEKRQFLPRTKLVKTNSTMQTVMKFEQEIGIIDYDDTIRKKKPDYEDISSNNGQMHSPL